MASEQVQTVATELEDCVNAAFEDCVNVAGNGEDMVYLTSQMANMHRTLTQFFTGKFIVPFVKEMAERYRNGYFDLRNEATCKVCDTMWKALEDNGFAYNGEWAGFPLF